MCYGGGKVKSNFLEKNSYTYIKVVRVTTEKKYVVHSIQTSRGKN